MVKKLHIKEDVEIEVKNTGVLEVPENKNVDELPIKHFVALANKKGLSTVTRALNNLQVWNKNKDPKLSKWAGDMIDKVTTRIENQKKNESFAIHKIRKSIDTDNLTENFNKDFIDNCIADMEIIGFTYDDTDNRGRLVFNSIDGNSSQAFPDWEEVRNYIDNGSFPYEFESVRKESSDTDLIDYRLECADYAIYHVVTNNTGIELISDNTNGKYELGYNGVTVEVEFNLEGTAKYEYTIDGEGPYVHNSYEYITNDIRDYVDEIMDEEDDIDESCTLTEFSSNFEGTEFGEVEFYSPILKDYPESIIKNTIQAKCPFPINIYNVDNEWDGNISVAYEVKEEDYDPDEINITVVKLLQDLENSLER